MKTTAIFMQEIKDWKYKLDTVINYFQNKMAC
jgi:hypothetical protein